MRSVLPASSKFASRPFSSSRYLLRSHSPFLGTCPRPKAPLGFVPRSVLPYHATRRTMASATTFYDFEPVDSKIFPSFQHDLNKRQLKREKV